MAEQLPTGTGRRFDFPRALAAFLNRDEVYRELPPGLRDTLLKRALAA